MAILDWDGVEVPPFSASSVPFCGFRGGAICFCWEFLLRHVHDVELHFAVSVQFSRWVVVGFCLRGVSLFFSSFFFLVLAGIESRRLFLGRGGS